MKVGRERLAELGLLQVGLRVGGSSIASNRWPWAARARVPVIPSPRQGGMELCGRSRAGSIKRATTPPGGGHDTHEHAPGCGRAVHPAFGGAGARQRSWPSAGRVDQREQLRAAATRPIPVPRRSAMRWKSVAYLLPLGSRWVVSTAAQGTTKTSAGSLHLASWARFGSSGPRHDVITRPLSLVGAAVTGRPGRAGRRDAPAGSTPTPAAPGG